MLGKKLWINFSFFLISQEVGKTYILSFPFLVYIIYKIGLGFIHNKEQCYTRYL